MNSVELLRELPATSVLETKLRLSGCAVLADSEVAAVLGRYSKARAALARNVAEASARAMGLACAAAGDELPPHEAARVAHECAEYLEALIS